MRRVRRAGGALGLLAHPKRVLLAALVFFVVAGVFGGPVAGLLSTNDEFSDPGSESVAADERLEDATGRRPTPGIVLLVRPAADGADVARRLERVEGVGRVVQPGRVARPAGRRTCGDRRAR